ncbi:MAG: SPL family radical SAM protein [Armatimonadota bacterium]
MVSGIVRIREITAKSLLSDSGIARYAVNCYIGCLHSCVYCYARFMRRFTGHPEPWGRFLDVKVNAPEVLQKDVKRRPPGRVVLSSVCDGWQPAERHYQLSRRCLQILVDAGFEVSILTKSALAARDLDILRGYGPAEVGVTITTADETLRAQIEPGASPTAARVEVLRAAAGRGIRIYAFLGPFLPGLSDGDENLDSLMSLLEGLPLTHIWVDRLNPRPGVWPSVAGFLRRHHSHLANRFADSIGPRLFGQNDLLDFCRKVLFDEETRAVYSANLSSRVRSIAADHGLDSLLRIGF